MFVTFSGMRFLPSVAFLKLGSSLMDSLPVFIWKLKLISGHIICDLEAWNKKPSGAWFSVMSSHKNLRPPGFSEIDLLSFWQM